MRGIFLSANAPAEGMNDTPKSSDQSKPFKNGLAAIGLTVFLLLTLGTNIIPALFGQISLQITSIKSQVIAIFASEETKTVRCMRNAMEKAGYYKPLDHDAWMIFYPECKKTLW